MPSLHSLQRAFADGVLRDDSTAICSAIAARGIEPSRRLNIYRNNAREGFLKTLEATFPIILRLAGLDWFRQTGTTYWRAHPSTSGNLHYVGQHFAAFLDAQLVGSAYHYFAAVARLEWAYQEVLIAADHPSFDIAADHPSFDIAALGEVDANDYGALRFRTHPALRLVASAYPLLAIWHANKATDASDCADETTIDLDAGASRLLVIRRDDHVELRELNMGDFALLDAFAHGRTFEEAAEAALAADNALDLGACLARLVQLGAFVDFSLDPDVSRDDRNSYR